MSGTSDRVRIAIVVDTALRRLDALYDNGQVPSGTRVTIESARAAFGLR